MSGVVGILNIQDHVLVNYVERRDMNLKIVPSQNHPKEVPEQTTEFCIECMVPQPPGRCILQIVQDNRTHSN